MLCVILLFFYPLHLYVFVLICQYYVVLLERTNKDIIYNDVFSVVNMYLNYLKFCIVCINGRRYVRRLDDGPGWMS